MRRSNEKKYFLQNLNKKIKITGLFELYANFSA